MTHGVFSSCCSFFFPRLISGVAEWMSTILDTWCGLSANLECRSEMCCALLAGNAGPRKTEKVAKKSPSLHHRTTLSGYIFATKHARIDNGRNLLSSNISSRCPHNMANFGPLAAEIDPVLWAPLQISTGFASWQRYCTAL